MKLKSLRSFAVRRLRAARLRPPPAGLRSAVFAVLLPPAVDGSPLAAQLHAHPDVLCHEDMEGPLSERGYAGADAKALAAARKSKELASFRNSSPAAYLYKYVLDSRGHLAVGFITDHATLLSSANAHLRDVLQQDRDLQVLLYGPRNTLHAYATRLWQSRALEGAAVPAVEVDPREFLLHAREQDRMNAYVEHFFEGHAQMKVYGEDLASPKQAVALQGVAKFLGLEAFPATPAGGTGAGLRAMVSNLTALEAALHGTPYAWMLEA